MKEIKDDINRWRDTPCFWVTRINIVKMTILPNAIYRFNAIPIKSPKAFFTELEQKISQFICKHKRPQIANSLEREKWSQRNQASWLQIILQSYCHRDRWYWYKNRNIEQWNKIESPEISPCTYGQLIFDKRSKNIQWGKDSLFNKWCCENWTAACKRMK